MDSTKFSVMKANVLKKRIYQYVAESARRLKNPG